MTNDLHLFKNTNQQERQTTMLPFRDFIQTCINDLRPAGLFTDPLFSDTQQVIHLLEDEQGLTEEEYEEYGSGYLYVALLALDTEHVANIYIKKPEPHTTSDYYIEYTQLLFELFTDNIHISKEYDQKDPKLVTLVVTATDQLTDKVKTIRQTYVEDSVYFNFWSILLFQFFGQDSSRYVWQGQFPDSESIMYLFPKTGSHTTIKDFQEKYVQDYFDIYPLQKSDLDNILYLDPSNARQVLDDWNQSIEEHIAGFGNEHHEGIPGYDLEEPIVTLDYASRWYYWNEIRLTVFRLVSWGIIFPLVGWLWHGYHDFLVIFLAGFMSVYCTATYFWSRRNIEQQTYLFRHSMNTPLWGHDDYLVYGPYEQGGEGVVSEYELQSNGFLLTRIKRSFLSMVWSAGPEITPLSYQALSPQDHQIVEDLFARNNIQSTTINRLSIELWSWCIWVMSRFVLFLLLVVMLKSFFVPIEGRCYPFQIYEPRTDTCTIWCNEDESNKQCDQRHIDMVHKYERENNIPMTSIEDFTE